MRNTKCLLYCFFIFTSLSNAQSIKWGPLMPNDGKGRLSSILRADENGIYVLREIDEGFNPKAALIEKYDFSGLNKISTTPIQYSDPTIGKGKDFRYENAYSLKDNMIVIMYTPDAKDAYAIKINPDGSLDKNKVFIGVVSGKKSQGEPLNYHFRVTKDGSAIVASYVNDDTKKIDLVAIDENLKTLWSKEIQLSYGFDEINIGDPQSFDGKNVLFQIYLKKEHKPLLEIYDPISTKIKEVNLALSNGLVRGDNTSTFNNLGDYIYAGYYNDGVNKSYDFGSFICKVDHSTWSVTVNRSTPFDPTFADKMAANYKASSTYLLGKVKAIPAAIAPSIKIMDDESILLHGELFCSNSLVNQAGGYYNVIVTECNPDGSVSWTRSVAKNQIGYQTVALYQKTSGRSYGYFISENANNVYVFYDESIKNSSNNSQSVLDGDNTGLECNRKIPALMMESIDKKTGGVKRQPIISGAGEKEELLVLVTITKQISNGRIIILRGDDNAKQIQLGVLTLP